MKINKGKILNINKRLISGGLSLTLVTLSLTGCGTNGRLEYEINEHGDNVCVSEASYDYLKECKVLVFEKNSKIMVCLAKEVNYDTYYNNYTAYYNIFGEQEIYRDGRDGNEKINSLKLLSNEPFVNYLIEYDKIKDTYTEQELKEIVDMIRDDYQKENNKELVKEK